MAHYQQGHHAGQPAATRVDEYGNPIPAAGHTGTSSYDAGGYGQQAGYGPTGTGTHDVGGYGGSGHPAYGATGTGVHDAGGPGGYGATGIGPHGTHGVAGIHDGGGLSGGHTGMHEVTGTGTHGTGAGYGTHGGATGMHDTGVLGGGGHTAGMAGATGTGTHGTGHGATAGGVTGTHGAAAFPHAAEHKTGGILRRSGSSSSSSSSSEDDGMGGRRKKKGLKEKIKEKLPGGRKDNQGQATAATGAYGGTTATGTGTTGGAYTPTTTAGGAHEKKGVVEKIKEKLPGGHKDHDLQHTTATTGGYAPGRTGTTDTYGTTTTTAEGTHEKKGFMEKIKEKLPGQH